MGNRGSRTSVLKTSLAQESQQLDIDSQKEASTDFESSLQSSAQSTLFPVSVCAESVESFYNPITVFNYGTPVDEEQTKGWWQHGVHWRETAQSLSVERPLPIWRRTAVRSDPRFAIHQDDVSTELAYPLPLPREKPSMLAEDKSWHAYRILADNGMDVQKVPTVKLPKHGSQTSPSISKAESAPVLKQTFSTASSQQGGIASEQWSKFADMGKTVPLSALPNLSNVTREDKALWSRTTTLQSSSNRRTTLQVLQGAITPVDLASARNAEISKKQATRTDNHSATHEKRTDNFKYFPNCSKMVDLGIDGYTVPKKWIQPSVTQQESTCTEYNEVWVESRISRRRREAALEKAREKKSLRKDKVRVSYVPKRPKAAWIEDFEAGKFRLPESPPRGKLVLQSTPIFAF